MDAAEVNRVVTQVDGVTSVDITLTEGGGVSGWRLRGDIGLPDDPTEARAVYENCLRAIASVPVTSSSAVSVSVYGVTAGSTIIPRDIGVPDDTTNLKEHFN